ncbi:Leucine-zipper-like transcriptional regulator 1 [Tieghemiomyces parasiticus]|uniref:Leucine-zipper-like transcriptional regulator 1 n=1 Tax=Tieghemiomyces parasiticus TaxID=78921 RepID=A0A9W8DLA7_9FUNG|nr:Leucine-zipper-like transcriptional regulator 1 [Tieghemiomyces parasiticus]
MRFSTGAGFALAVCAQAILFAGAVQVPPRHSHRAVVLDNKFYVVAGKGTTGFNQTDFMNTSLVLDLSKPFSANDPPWDLTSMVADNMPRVGGHSLLATKARGKPELIVYGGTTFPEERGTDPVRVYDIETRSWSEGNFANTPARRYEHSTVPFEGSNSAIIYGGILDYTTGSEKSQTSAKLYVLDAAKSQWISFNSDLNQPDALMHHSAVMLDDTRMAIIGGHNDESMAGTGSIHIFDTVKQSWSVVKVSGTGPKDIRSAPAVVFNDQIIFFGGTNGSWDDVFDQLLILDMSVQPWAWRSRVISNPPSPRYAHTATLVGKYVIIAFGYKEIAPQEFTSDDQIFVMDVDKFQMVDTFDLREAMNFEPSSRSAKLSVGAIVGIVVGAFFLILAVVVLALYYTGRGTAIVAWFRRTFRRNHDTYRGPMGEGTIIGNCERITRELDPRRAHMEKFLRDDRERVISGYDSNPTNSTYVGSDVDALSRGSHYIPPFATAAGRHSRDLQPLGEYRPSSPYLNDDDEVDLGEREYQITSIPRRRLVALNADTTVPAPAKSESPEPPNSPPTTTPPEK